MEVKDSFSRFMWNCISSSFKDIPSIIFFYKIGNCAVYFKGELHAKIWHELQAKIYGLYVKYGTNCTLE